MLKRFHEKFGPGFIFAALAIGISHLVQSTRAGADYGFSFMWVLILACLIKYPAFRFASDYAITTRSSLVDAYERQGRWVLLMLIVLLLTDTFIGAAAVALVTAGIVKSVFHLDTNVVMLASLLISGCGLVLIVGKYGLFETITKIFVVIFALSSLLAAGLSLPRLDLATANLMPDFTFSQSTILFMIAVAGFMPSSMSSSVLQSLWVKAKAKSLNYTITPKEVRLDFNIGYGFTMFLAICFMFMGTVYLFHSGIPVSKSSDGFAGQLIQFFTSSIGEWAYPVIASCAIAVMISTLLTLVDGCPRAYAMIIRRLRSEAEPDYQIDRDKLYSGLIVVQIIGVICVLTVLFRSFSTFIDLAASISFLAAPFIAYFNHRAIFSDAIPVQLQPGRAMRLASVLCIAAMIIICLGYLYLNFLAP